MPISVTLDEDAQGARQLEAARLSALEEFRHLGYCGRLPQRIEPRFE